MPPSLVCRSCNSRRRSPAPDAASAAPSAVAAEEAETISRTLLLAQRTADTTIAEAEREANQIIESAKAESRKAGEAERVRVEGEVQALLARRDFLESDVEQLDQFLAAQRDRITAVAADLNDVTTRVGNGLGPDAPAPALGVRQRPLRRDSRPATATSGADDAEDEADVAELIEQVGHEGAADEAAAPPATTTTGAIRCSRPTSNSKCVPRAGHDAAGC